MNRRSSMLKKVEHYLAYRRNLGYELRYDGQLLRQFARMRMTSSTAVRSLWNWLCVGHGCRPTVHRCTGAQTGDRALLRPLSSHFRARHGDTGSATARSSTLP